VTARVVIASSADADYAEILTDLVARAGLRTATKYNELFERLYDRLADHPHSGAPRPVLGRSIRIGIVAPYIVIYRDEDDNIVTVLRIVHGRRRITGKMLQQTSS
jgi:toxin ParE1/3/4